MKESNDAYVLIKALLSSEEAAAKLLAEQPHLLESKTSVGETTLHYLVVENNISEVEWLLKHGANINTRCDSDTTPLMHAAQLGYEDTVKLLIKNGADVNLQDDLEETAFFKAARNGYIKILELLLKANADPSISDGVDSIFDVLLGRKREALLEILAKYGHSPK